MKIIINEADVEDLVITIQCKKVDDEILALIARIKMQDEKIVGMQGEKTYVIEPNDILYFDSVDKKTFIYTENEVYDTSLRLYEIEKMLRHKGFFRASKSTIVNIAKIKSIKTAFNSTMCVEMDNDEKLTVSRQYAPILKERLVKK